MHDTHTCHLVSVLGLMSKVGVPCLVSTKGAVASQLHFLTVRQSACSFPLVLHLEVLEFATLDAVDHLVLQVTGDEGVCLLEAGGLWHELDGILRCIDVYELIESQLLLVLPW